MAYGLGTVLLAAAWSQSPLPPRLALATDTGLLVLAKGGERQEFERGLTPLGWSPNARYLVVQTPSKRLELIEPDNARKRTALAMTEFGGWDPTGKWFLAGASDGIWKVDPAGTPQKLLPIGSLPTIAPEGSRFAFARPDREGGLWIADADGSNPRKILKPTPIATTWSPDGRKIAVVVRDKGKLFVSTLEPSGAKARRIGEVESSDISWSPGSSRILVREKTGYRAIGLDGVGSATLSGWRALAWTGTRKLIGFKDKVAGVDLAKGTDPIEIEFPTAPATAISAFNGLMVEGRENDPLDSAPGPKTGQIRVRGLVTAIDLESQAFSLRVDSMIDATGKEIHYAEPRTLNLLATGGFLRGVRRDAEASVLLAGERLTGGGTVLGVTTEETMTAATRPERPIRVVEYDGVTMEEVTVPLIFPAIGKVSWSDSFLAPRGGGTRRHHGQDLMGKKMTPLVAAFDGTVSFSRGRDRGNAGIMLTLDGDNGYRGLYIHINNDNPGTDDGLGGDRYAFAPNLQPGDRVVAGQFLGWLGDSGNAETTAPHLHFELHDAVGGGILNAKFSLSAAKMLDAPVHIVPVPDLKAPAGKTRFDGVVTSVDPASGRITFDLVATMDATMRPTVCLTPTAFTLMRPAGSKFPVRSNPTASWNFQDLKPGQGITVFASSSAQIGSADQIWVDLR
jgi:murein DD-endopeptidase MepM/ murein hydrolase activator NlpD